MIWEYDEEEEWDDEEDDEEDEEGEKPRRRKRLSEERKTLYKAQKGRCMYCGFKGEIDRFQVDHKTPVARGGRDGIGNLQMLCSPCNNRKSDLTDGEFRNKYGLPGARDKRAEDPPEKEIPQSEFKKISKQSSRRRRTTRRREEEELEEWEEEDWDDDDEEEEEDEGWF